MKATHVDNNPLYVMFECPGCECSHMVTVKTADNDKGWGWNGSLESPTFTPSILVYPSHNQPRCHSFVTDGMIRFLEDCEHPLKGQTVQIPDIETT